MATFQRPPTEALICSLVPAAELEDVGIQTKCAFATQTPGDLPVAQRMRAAYWLKHTYDNGEDEAEKRSARRALERAAAHAPHGSLLRHECAYVLGQLRDAQAAPALQTILCDTAEDAMLRHECAEALGAIGEGDAVLERLSRDASEPFEVRQTCEIARDFLKWRRAGSEGEAPIACACMLSPYNSHDPAPPDPAHVNWSCDQLEDKLRDASADMFERYRCMFSLRNRGGEDCVRALGRTLQLDTSSPLLRHEVAFVLGQLQHPASLEYLEASLRRKGEHAIVRHEAAEAAGALEGCWEACEKLLGEFRQDADVVVAQSCEVALDAADYFGRASFAQEKAGHFNLASPAEDLSLDALAVASGD